MGRVIRISEARVRSIKCLLQSVLEIPEIVNSDHLTTLFRSCLRFSLLTYRIQFLTSPLSRLLQPLSDLSHPFLNQFILLFVNAFSPTAKISHHVFVIKLGQCHYLSVHFMLFDVLIQGQMHPYLLDGVEIGIQFVFDPVTHPESPLAQKFHLLKRILIPTVLQKHLTLMRLFLLLFR